MEKGAVVVISPVVSGGVVVIGVEIAVDGDVVVPPLFFLTASEIAFAQHTIIVIISITTKKSTRRAIIPSLFG